MPPRKPAPDTKPAKNHTCDEWYKRHIAAYHAPVTAPERAIVGLIKSWLLYAETHYTRYGSLIGDDGVLGPHWAGIGVDIRGLLNGDTGVRLDCGTLDALILDSLKAHGSLDPVAEVP